MSRRWHEIERLFREGLAVPHGARQAWLRHATEDGDLRAELTTLWSAHAAVGARLDSPLGPPGARASGRPDGPRR